MGADDRVRQAHANRGTRQVKSTAKNLEALAEKSAKKWRTMIQENPDSRWIDEFLEWRDAFAYTAAAQGVMASFKKLRASHEEPAKKLIQAARQAFNNGNRDLGYSRYQEIVEKYYASSRYRSAKRWLLER